MIKIDPIYTSFHLTGYPDGIDVSANKHPKARYLFHALVVPTDGGNCFLYGLDESLTREHFEELKEELRLMRFVSVSWHKNGAVHKEML